MTAFSIAAATAVMTLVGGLLVLRLEAQRGLVLAFCAGALVACALLKLIPEALDIVGSGGRLNHHHLFAACALGFLVFYLLEHSMHHERAGRGDHPSRYDHPCQAGLWGAAGICAHSFLDGVAVGGAFRAGADLGWAVALAVLSHKIADGASAVGVMLGTRHTARVTTAVLGVSAAAPAAGLWSQSFIHLPQPVLGLLLGWFAGVFLYLGASTLLPAAHEHSHSRWLPVSTLAGAVALYLTQAWPG